MTAGSIELFPIRVAPIGVPPLRPLPMNPSPILRERVCRNLFGVSAEPGSVESELRNEERNKIAEWKRRFNVDLDEMKTAAAAAAAAATETKRQKKSSSSSSSSLSVPSTEQPNLIEKEQKAYEQRLADEKKEKEKCNLSSEKLREAAETTPQPTHRNGTTANNLSTKHRNHCSNDGLGSRSLPYARQKLISECFTTRRKPITQISCLERQKNWSDLWEETPASGEVLLLNTSTIKETAPSSIQYPQQQQQHQRQQQKQHQHPQQQRKT